MLHISYSLSLTISSWHLLTECSDAKLSPKNILPQYMMQLMHTVRLRVLKQNWTTSSIGTWINSSCWVMNWFALKKITWAAFYFPEILPKGFHTMCRDFKVSNAKEAICSGYSDKKESAYWLLQICKSFYMPRSAIWYNGETTVYITMTLPP